MLTDATVPNVALNRITSWFADHKGGLLLAATIALASSFLVT